jgi:hypothetical protein
LSIAAAAINGFANRGKTSVLSGDVITLSNAKATSANSGTGTGNLQLNAREILLGSGNYALNGFRQVSLNAAEAILGQGRTVDPLTQKDLPAGTGTLSVAGNLAMNAPRFGGEAGATTVVDASGHRVTIASAPAANPLAAAALGASWTVKGDAIRSSGHFDLPSGILNLQAENGDLVLAAGSSIDVSGQSQSFGNLARYSSAGNVFLQADGNSNVVLSSGAVINLAAATLDGQQMGDAGLLQVKAASGQFDWSGDINAHGTGSPDFQQGRFRLDVARLGKGGFSGLNQKLAASGFTGEISLEQRQGDITVAKGDQVNAQLVQLAADQGKVTVAGTINASAPKAGAVSIYGRNGITLAATAEIDARALAAGEAGGKVTLDTVHRDDVGSGLLDLAANGSVIDVSAGANGTGGAVHLRTGRDDSNTINASAINTTLKGASQAALEATKIYDGVSTIDATQIATMQTDTANFMSAAVRPANPNITLMPGIEVRSSGDLTLEAVKDFRLM